MDYLTRCLTPFFAKASKGMPTPSPGLVLRSSSERRRREREFLLQHAPHAATDSGPPPIEVAENGRNLDRDFQEITTGGLGDGETGGGRTEWERGEGRDKKYDGGTGWGYREEDEKGRVK